MNETAFFNRVMPEPNSGCWLWTGRLMWKGYGTFVEEGKEYRAHREAWRLYRGEIPADLLVCHKCDVRSCVNPAHLFLGTVDDNNKDRHRKGKYESGDAIRQQMRESGATRQGIRHHNARLTEEDVRKIRESTSSGVAMAGKYGVSRFAISNIRLRKTWRHV